MKMEKDNILRSFAQQLSQLGSTNGIAFVGTRLFTELSGKAPEGEISELEVIYTHTDKTIYKIKCVTGVGYAIPADQGIVMDIAYYELMAKAAEPLILENRKN